MVDNAFRMVLVSSVSVHRLLLEIVVKLQVENSLSLSVPNDGDFR